jgi:peptidase C39-like protein
MRAHGRSRVLFAVLAFVIAITASASGRAYAAKTSPAPSTSFARFDLSGGIAAGVTQSGGTLTLASSGLSSGTYTDPFGYGDIAEQYGTWTSPSRAVPFAFDELVASWNAATPTGTWITIEMAATGSGRTTKWYTMGIWASGDDTIHRTSVGGQGDTDGFIAIDTFIRDKKAAALDSYQLRIGLHRVAGGWATPNVRFIGAMTSAAATYDMPSPQYAGAAEIAVPRYSQEIHRGEFTNFDGGGEAWCSPTSTAMILDKWGSGPTAAELAVFPGPTKPDGTPYVDAQVDYAARYVYDYHYQGAGNWPFNAAYAGSRGLNAFVTRLRSLAEAERFIAAGIPLVASINGKLPGFFFKKTSGHLLTIVGFTASGDVISNDPAVPDDSQVRRIYGRADFESVWLGGSAGIVYVIYPNGTALPANVPNLPANW